MTWENKVRSIHSYQNDNHYFPIHYTTFIKYMATGGIVLLLIYWNCCWCCYSNKKLTASEGYMQSVQLAQQAKAISWLHQFPWEPQVRHGHLTALDNHSPEDRSYWVHLHHMHNTNAPHDKDTSRAHRNWVIWTRKDPEFKPVKKTEFYPCYLITTDNAHNLHISGNYNSK